MGSYIHLSHVSEGEKHQPKCLRNHQQVNLDLPLASWEGATPDDDHEPTKNEGKRGVKPAFKKEWSEWLDHWITKPLANTLPQT